MKLEKILDTVLYTPSSEGGWGIPILIEGVPGIGKTHGLRAAAVHAALPFYRISPGERGEGQFGVTGVPFAQADGTTRLGYPAPDWVDELTNGGVLFVDELTTAAPGIQAALLGLIQLRTIGSYTMNDRVRMVAACNSVDDTAGGYELAPGIENRFIHLNWEGLSAADWATGLLGGFASPVVATEDARKREKSVLAAWPNEYPKIAGLVAGFIRRRPDLLWKRPKPGEKGAGRAWPSPRTCTYATHLLTASAIAKLDEESTDILLSGVVGEGWASEFRTWQNTADLPDPLALLEGREKWTHDKKRLDRTLCVLYACASLLDKAPDRATKDKASSPAWTSKLLKLLDLVGPLLADIPDIAVDILKVLQASDTRTNTTELSKAICKSPWGGKMLPFCVDMKNGK